MQRSGSSRGLRGASTGASSAGYNTPIPQARTSSDESTHSARPPAPKDCYYLTQDPEPLAPYAAIASTQALMSTFPSRLRLGTSTLMQPSTTQEKEAAKPVQIPSAPAQAAAAAAAPAVQTAPVPQIPSEYGLGRRARSQIVNYAEPGAGEFDEDDKDQYGGPEAGPVLTARGRLLASRKDSGSGRHQPTPSTSSTMLNGKDKDSKDSSAFQAVHSWIPPRSYLDAPPPGHLVLAEPARRTKHLYSPQHIMQAKAAKRSVLVPIRIELDTEAHRIRDQFTWNTQEDFVTPEHFAAIFCEDLGLPESFRRQVSTSIRQQLETHASIAEISLEPDLEDSMPTPEDRLESDPDLRVILMIDVQLGMLRLVDKLEWDLGSPHSPDLVARSLCQDLALPTDAAPTVAHAIHEEILRAKRECLEMGILGEQMHVRGAKRLEGVWREWSDTLDFGPRVELMDWEELERYERDRDRAAKRARRNVVGSGARRRR